MKVIFVGGYNILSQGGIENYMLNLAKQLKKKGHLVYIISRGRENKNFSVDGISITQLKIKENLLSILVHNICASWHLFKHSKKADVVNFQSIFLPFLYEWLPKLKGIKVVHTQHSFAQDNPKYGNKTKWIICVLYRLSGIVFSPIITVSEYNKRLIRRRLKKDATVINCGVNFPESPQQTEILDTLGIKQGEFYLTIGRIDPVKNLHILIKAFLKHPKGQSVKLVICGDMNNSYGKYLYNLTLGDERIIFPGIVSGQNKEQLLSSCKAYCLVSSSEGFPIALLEAMAHGNICLCSDIPACKEVLSESMGLWCKVNDEQSLWDNMQKIESIPGSFEDLKYQVRKRVEDSLTWEKISIRYIKYLHEIIRGVR